MSSYSLALDGDTAIVGAAWEVDGPGAAYVFRLDRTLPEIHAFGNGVSSLPAQ